MKIKNDLVKKLFNHLIEELFLCNITIKIKIVQCSSKNSLYSTVPQDSKIITV